MIEAIETWIFDQLSAQTALLEQFDTDNAPLRVIRSGGGEEKDTYPAVMYTFAGELERETDRCGELVRCVLTWEVKAVVEGRSFALSQPYATQIEAALASLSGSDTNFVWKAWAGAIVGRRERGAGRQHYIHHGNIYTFEVSPAD